MEYTIRSIYKNKLKDLLEFYQHLHSIDAPLPPLSILEKNGERFGRIPIFNILLQRSIGSSFQCVPFQLFLTLPVGSDSIV